VVSEDNKLLQAAFAPDFKMRGFLKDGPTWRKTSPDAIVFFNIQGSQWGRQFHLNLGAYFRALGTEDRPIESRCHVRLRVSDLVPDRVRFNDLLDFEKAIAPSDRLEELAALVTEWGIPWLHAMSSCDAARNYMSGHPAPSLFVARDARAVLGLSSGAQRGAAADDRPQAGDRG
jgi:hypothetical protein